MWLYQAAAGLVAIYVALLLRRIVRRRLDRLDPQGHVPAGKLLRMSSFEGETVDEFLHRAFNSPFAFEGKEWADGQPPKDEPGPTYGGHVPGAARPDLERTTRPALPAAFRNLEPDSYYRVACVQCGDEKDMFTDEDGRPEREADMYHSHGDEGAFNTRPLP